MAIQTGDVQFPGVHLMTEGDGLPILGRQITHCRSSMKRPAAVANVAVNIDQ